MAFLYMMSRRCSSERISSLLLRSSDARMERRRIVRLARRQELIAAHVRPRLRRNAIRRLELDRSLRRRKWPSYAAAPARGAWNREMLTRELEGGPSAPSGWWTVVVLRWDATHPRTRVAPAAVLSGPMNRASSLVGREEPLLH